MNYAETENNFWTTLYLALKMVAYLILIVICCGLCTLGLEADRQGEFALPSAASDDFQREESQPQEGV